MEYHPLYPFQFVPILKEKVWGGNRLVNDFNKEGSGTLGESWELSAVPGNVSIVVNGTEKGKSLQQLIEIYREELVGKKVYEQFSTSFPLLFKFIDAAKDLSVQLHPDDALAQERHNSFGKTEMWYIMDASKDARLIVGCKKNTTTADYNDAIDNNKIVSILNTIAVNKGDAFFIAPGTIHAIGEGIVLAEIQQTSDVTYRLYDWDRPGTDGNMRELHIDLAKDAVKFSQEEIQLKYTQENDKSVTVCSVPYFETNIWKLTKSTHVNLIDKDSFVVYMCVDGEATVVYNTHTSQLAKGETILIPACITTIEITTKDATLLEVYIP